MEIREFAEHLLFGTTVSDKLLDFSSEGGFTDLESQSVRFREPRFPGRPRELLNLDQQDLPSLHQLDRGDAWAQMLHYFANHELLAIELMALSLLKFPGTPEAYRRGVVHTILEEQEHLQMYINRLKKLGVEFGDFAVNDFFWKQISAASSPQEFVVLMNMTFEQANLDFSLHYKGIAAQLGDQESVSILDKIHHDEIRHVGHGVKWFNRWRKESGDLKSDWQAFLQNLPPGVSARRARGIGFCSESRLEAGLSQEFIHELEVCGGSKGRPSDLYFFNPEVDLHHLEKPLDRSALPEPFREIIADLESLPIFYMKESDVLLVEDAPRREWLHHLHSRGVQIPEIREWNFAKFKDLADESRK